MVMNIEEAKEKLIIGERAGIETESTITIFKEVTNVEDALTALDNPEIRLGADKKRDLVCIAEGVIESITPKEILKDNKGRERERKR